MRHQLHSFVEKRLALFDHTLKLLLNFFWHLCLKVSLTNYIHFASSFAYSVILNFKVMTFFHDNFIED